MISLIVVSLGAVAAALGTGLLAARCARAPRSFQIAWTVALFGLTVALGAQALGYIGGYTGTIFRAMELGGQALAPLALCLGLTELLGRSVPARFAMRLGVCAPTFSSSWADPSVFYDPPPKVLIFFLACFTIVTALGALITMQRRSSRHRGPLPVKQPALRVVGGAVAVALPGLTLLVHMPVPGSYLFAVTCVLAAALIWLAARAAERGGLLDAEPGGRDRRGGRYDDDDFGEPKRSPYRGDRYDLDADYPEAGYGDAGRSGGELAGAGRRARDPDADLRYPGLAELAAEPSGPAAGPGRGEPASYAGNGGFPLGPDASPHGKLFGQITIYTLIDDRVADFDLLTGRVVEQVREQEPGTLVYIVHEVPTAPMQRILYEVYQDRMAYQEHLSRTYVARYEAERRRLVLATNVIELGLQQAKVTPLPSYSAISELLSESGIDLTGVTRQSRSATQATNVNRSPRGAGPAPPDGHQRQDPRDLLASGPGRPGPGAAGTAEPGLQGWADIRREDDPWYR